MSTIILRSAESVHWYEQNGSPKYTVTAKDGSQRPTTLRDARKLDLVPSVTTVMSIMSKPGLEQWKLEQMLLAALTLPRLASESEKSYIARIVHDSKEAGKKAADAGTAIHESIEKWMKGDKAVEHAQTARVFEEAVFNHFNTHPCQPWIMERSFTHGKGFGGKVDMFCLPDEHAPTGIVVDTKTKDFDYGDNIDVYAEHVMQLAAYRMGLGMPHARCANVFVSRTNPELVKIVEHSAEDIERGWKMFLCLLGFWQLKNKFGAAHE